MLHAYEDKWTSFFSFVFIDSWLYGLICLAVPVLVSTGAGAVGVQPQACQ